MCLSLKTINQSLIEFIRPVTETFQMIPSYPLFPIKPGRLDGTVFTRCIQRIEHVENLQVGHYYYRLSHGEWREVKQHTRISSHVGGCWFEPSIPPLRIHPKNRSDNSPEHGSTFPWFHNPAVLVQIIPTASIAVRVSPIGSR